MKYPKVHPLWRLWWLESIGVIGTMVLTWLGATIWFHDYTAWPIVAWAIVLVCALFIGRATRIAAASVWTGILCAFTIDDVASGFKSSLFLNDWLAAIVCLVFIAGALFAGRRSIERFVALEGTLARPPALFDLVAGSLSLISWFLIRGHDLWAALAIVSGILGAMAARTWGERIAARKADPGA